jgi:hypothetical protein
MLEASKNQAPEMCSETGLKSEGVSHGGHGVHGGVLSGVVSVSG